VALSLIAVLVAIVGGALVVVTLMREVGAQLNEVAARIQALEKRVDGLSEAALPAFTTFLGTVGVTVFGLVSIPAGAGAAVAFAVVTFAFASLAKNPSLNPVRRWLAAVAAVSPVAGIAAIAIVSGRLGGLSAATTIALVVLFVIELISLLGVIHGVLKKQIPDSTATATA
jgi:Mn2+/Fe2+ NRAMP family transporter